MNWIVGVKHQILENIGLIICHHLIFPVLVLVLVSGLESVRADGWLWVKFAHARMAKPVRWIAQYTKIKTKVNVVTHCCYLDIVINYIETNQKNIVQRKR